MAQFFPCFKAYDIRGKVPGELHPELAQRIGRAFADETGAQSVCIGYDIRLSGGSLADALTLGLQEAGVSVTDLGLVGTEMVYFATAHYGFDGGIMITASHNPPEYNGMKMVRTGSRPISSDSGLNQVEARAFAQNWERHGAGSLARKNVYADFVRHLLSFTQPDSLKPLCVLADPGNGAAGLAMDALIPHLPIEVTRMQWEPDGTFPNGVPNPILAESRAKIVEKLRGGGYDFGVAWDGDYDRCFFLDGQGNFIEGYYIVGLLARAILKDNPGQTVIYDPRLYWNTLDIVKELGGRAVVCKSGHAFIKEKMRAEDAIYGGEMSAHHYFRGNWYCDSGMIPLILVCNLLSQTGQSLGETVAEMIRKYPCSGEINVEVQEVAPILVRVAQKYTDGVVSNIDGLSVEYPQWRFNLRGSNTEPVIRLNVETRGDEGLLAEKTEEILLEIGGDK